MNFFREQLVIRKNTDTSNTIARPLFAAMSKFCRRERIRVSNGERMP